MSCGCPTTASGARPFTPPPLLVDPTAPLQTLAASADSLLARRGPGTYTHPVATERLMRYWGSPGQKGYAKIGWGRPCDFCRCLTQLRKYVKRPDYLRGLCANLHKRALGTWPGRESRSRDKKNHCPC